MRIRIRTTLVEYIPLGQGARQGGAAERHRQGEEEGAAGREEAGRGGGGGKEEEGRKEGRREEKSGFRQRNQYQVSREKAYRNPSMLVNRIPAIFHFQYNFGHIYNKTVFKNTRIVCKYDQNCLQMSQLAGSLDSSIPGFLQTWSGKPLCRCYFFSLIPVLKRFKTL